MLFAKKQKNIYLLVSLTINLHKAKKICGIINILVRCLSLPGHVFLHDNVVFGPFQVWKALLKEMPVSVLLKHLGKLAADKVLIPGSPDIAAVCERIQDETVLKKVFFLRQ